ncbi:hypothetical protein QR510_28275, partial [Escherichia coli]|uniref:hypothetical protein n=1 Tax=Escherichia coli TaxID=562 RepID=UPI0027390183
IRNRGFMRASRGPIVKERMLEKRQQSRRRKFFRNGLRNEARENARRRIHERVAARIVEVEVPASERSHHAAGERAIRCD